MARDVMRLEQEENSVQFQPGNTFGKGRPKGSRHRIAESLLAVLADDFEQHGAAVVASVREKRPADYLKVMASLLPKELAVSVDAKSPEDMLVELDDEPS